MSCAEYERFAEFYDHVTLYRERPDVAFFVEMAREVTGPILEVGCGTGRVLLPCARAGATMVGLDLSPHMLEVARRRLRDEPAEVRHRVTLIEGDMRALDLGTRFELITLPFRGFQHLMTAEDQRLALRRFRAHLTPGGRLVIDVFNPSIPFLGDERFSIHPMREPAFTMPDGRRVVRSYRISARDFPQQTQEVEFTIDVTYPDGREAQHLERFWLRYVFRFELEYLLECEGFRVEALYGDYDKSPFGTRYPGEIIAVARLVTERASTG